MTEKPIDGDNLGEVWDALLSNEGFEVCYDELFSLCYHVNKIEHLGLIGILIILTEVFFWVFVVRTIYKRRLKKRSISDE